MVITTKDTVYTVVFVFLHPWPQQQFAFDAAGWDTLIYSPWAVKEPQQNLSLPRNELWEQYKSQSLKARGVCRRREEGQKEKESTYWSKTWTTIIIFKLTPSTDIHLKCIKQPSGLMSLLYMKMFMCCEENSWVWMSFCIHINIVASNISV